MTRRRPIRVAHLIDHMGLGGAQRMLIDLVETRSAGIRHSVIALRDGGLPENVAALADAGVPYQSIRLTRWKPWGIWRLRRTIAGGDFDILHAHLDYSTSLGLGAALSLGPRCPTLISHVHSNPWYQNSALSRAAAAAMAPRVGAFIVPGQSVRSALDRALRGRGERIEAIPPGLNLARFDLKRREQHEIDALRRGASRVIGYVGRLVPQKAVETLLASVPVLLADEPSTRVLIVGAGPSRNALQRECRRLGIADVVTFVGYVGEIWHCYGAMDVLTLVSEYEGFGIVTLEAMAMEVVVVATEVSGISDIVKHRENGLLVPFDDAHALGASILEVFANEKLRAGLQSTALNTVRNSYSRERMTESIESLYADLVAERIAG